ncbi:low molecular weight protein tyrosine phosphatase family protein [Sphingomonas sp. NY01]|uniref:low molecular weight protein tyrosine phosphatase family protein n=1 Tax=Sphingomonas sp. NY01 TaxID=2968057 RepID=UPI00315C8562
MKRPRIQTVLFVCSQNRLRSPTAEQVFSRRQDLEVDSAGTNHDAENPLTAELVAWADVIFVMEKADRSKLQRRFRAVLGGRRVVCLDIPDDCAFMQPELIQLLETKVSRHLPALPPTQEPDA